MASESLGFAFETWFASHGGFDFLRSAFRTLAAAIEDHLVFPVAKAGAQRRVAANRLALLVCPHGRAVHGRRLRGMGGCTSEAL